MKILHFIACLPIFCCMQASPIAIASPELPKKRKRLVKLGGAHLMLVPFS